MPPYFKGQVINKDLIIKNYKFCLVIENMSDVSFITEKIFHPIISGSIPIYLGAPDIDKYIPSECFIDLKNYKDWDQLCQFIVNFDINDYKKFLLNRKKFLKSKKFNEFSSKSFSEKIIKNI